MNLGGFSIYHLQDHTGGVEIVKWHPGCSYFGVATSDGQFRLWDINASKAARVFKPRKHSVSISLLSIFLHLASASKGPRVITCFRFGTDGTSIVCGYDNGKMEVIDLRKSSEVMSVTDAHEGPIWSIDCSRGNGNLIATGTYTSQTRDSLDSRRR